MSSRSAFRVLLLGLIVLVLMLGYQLKVSYESTLAQASDDADNLALTLDGQIEATLRRVESSMVHIASQLPEAALSLEAATAHRDRVSKILAPFTRSFPELGGFFVWDAQGNGLYDSVSSSPARERRSIENRRGFLELENNPSATIAFSESIRGVVSGAQTLAIYLPIRDGRGRLKGVITGTLNLGYFEKMFELLRLGPGSVVFVRRSDDHKLVIRYPLLASEYNKTVQNPLQARIDAGESAGRDRFQARTDGEYRLYGFRKLQQYPFYIVVGLSQSNALRAWYQDATYLGLGVLLMMLALGAVLFLMRRVKSQKDTAQLEANKAHQLLEEAVQSISAGFTIYDEFDRLVICNEAYLDMYQASRDLIVPGKTFEEIVRQGAERGQYVEAIGHVDEWVKARVKRHQEADGKQVEQLLNDGRWLLAIEHRTPSGYIVGNRIDITQRKRLESELRELATTDSLTGLPNRRHFLSRLDEELERVRRMTTQQACVMMLDLDHFKRINDTHGHSVGDKVLQLFANIMREQLRISDTSGRLGGEEFAIVLPGTSLQSAKSFAERLGQKLAELPIPVADQSIYVTVSIGITAIKPNDTSSDAVLMRADGALYQAKERGRNRVITA